MTTFYVVRHGESTWNVAGLLQGQSDAAELTARGLEQARAAAHQLAEIDIDALYSSDLRRAVQTATPIADRLGVELRRSGGLRERGYGSLEGLPSSRAVERAGQLDWLDPDVRPGGGESLRDVHTRVGTTLAQLSDAHPSGSVVLVSHGDTIRVVAACIARLGPHEIPWREVANGSITALTADPVSRRRPRSPRRANRPATHRPEAPVGRRSAPGRRAPGQP